MGQRRMWRVGKTNGLVKEGEQVVGQSADPASARRIGEFFAGLTGFLSLDISGTLHQYQQPSHLPNSGSRADISPQASRTGNEGGTFLLSPSEKSWRCSLDPWFVPLPDSWAEAAAVWHSAGLRMG